MMNVMEDITLKQLIEKKIDSNVDTLYGMDYDGLRYKDYYIRIATTLMWIKGGDAQAKRLSSILALRPSLGRISKEFNAEYDQLQPEDRRCMQIAFELGTLHSWDFVCEHLDPDDFRWLAEEEHIGYAIKYCIENSKFSNQPVEFMSEPVEVKFMASMLDALHKDDRKHIYLPFAGHFYQDYVFLGDCSIVGEEINSRVWAIGELLRFANGSKAKIEHRDSFWALQQKDEQFDFIYFIPPYGLGRENRKYDEYDAVWNAITNKLKEGGRLCCVLPNFSSRAGSGFKLRENLIASGYLRYVIQLPHIFDRSGISPVMIFVEKRRKDEFVVADATECRFDGVLGENSDVFKFLLNVSGKDKTCTRSIKCDEGALDKYLDLNPLRYLYTHPSPKAGESTCRIADLGQLVDSSQMSEEDIGARVVFGIHNLRDSFYSCSDVLKPLSFFRRGRIARIDKPSVVLSIFGGIRVGLIDPKDKPIYVGMGARYFILQLNNQKVLNEYFLKVMLSDEMSKQIHAFSSSVTKQISEHDFLNLKINLPSIERQYVDVNNELVKASVSLDLQMQSALERYKQEVRLQKHALGQQLSLLNSSWSILKKIIMESSKEGVSMGFPIPGDDTLNVGDVVKMVDNALKQTGVSVASLTKGEDERYAKEKLSLSQFVKNYVDTHPAKEYRVDYIEVQGLEANKRNTTFSPDALSRILLNVTTNAIEYGFAGRGRAKNIIRISLYSEGEYHVVEISNNGVPLAANLSPEDVLNSSSKCTICLF